MLNLNIFKITFFLTFFYGAGSSSRGHRGTWRRARAVRAVMAAAAQGDNDTGTQGLEEGGPWVGLGFMEGIDDV